MSIRTLTDKNMCELLNDLSNQSLFVETPKHTCHTKEQKVCMHAFKHNTHLR
eukprot:m.762119 g.762119  ORF g.762119 m.762119 type:complete len:52 (+) comp23208_c1_seq29:155-310(+)